MQPLQRDEALYHKLPRHVKHREILLMDPMLMDPMRAKVAMKCLLAAGVDEQKVVFVTVVSCPEGIAALLRAHPLLTVVTAALEQAIGDFCDFADRYYDTCDSE